MQYSKMFNMLKNAIWQCFHNQLSKSTLETRINAYAAVANVPHAEKRVYALFSSSTFEIYSRNSNIAIRSIRKCSTCRKTLFECVLVINF